MEGGGETAKIFIGGGEQSEKLEILAGKRRERGVKSEKKLGYPPSKWERKKLWDKGKCLMKKQLESLYNKRDTFVFLTAVKTIKNSI